MAQNIQAACGRTDAHGGHWDASHGRPCVGNVNVITAQDSAYAAAIAYAAAEGTANGRAAASWYFDGNTPDAAYAAALRGIDDGDPAVLDTIPAPDLSGQWADTLTGPQLYADAWHAAGIKPVDDAYDVSFSAICDAYETAFSDAAESAIETVARRMAADNG